jgi:UDP-glucose 4-epimerase
LTLAQAVTELLAPGHEIRIIGPRHGEKQHETLLSCEERSRAVSCGNCWRVPLDGRGLFYAADRANEEDCCTKEFNSNDALMSVEEVKALLKTVPLISNCSNT